jgi:hypothetical protein
MELEQQDNTAEHEPTHSPGPDEHGEQDILRAIPLSDYTSEKLRGAQVFKLDAAPRSYPIDINLPGLMQGSGWSPSDRLQLWHNLGGIVPYTGLTIRKLDLEANALLHCTLNISGDLSLLSNHQEFANRFFRDAFVESASSFSCVNDWEVTSRWTADPTTMSFFASSVAGALGWGSKVPPEIESWLKAALNNLEHRNWKSCVLMCRRALQILMEVAYAKQFGTKLENLALHDLIRRFEAIAPGPIPRHWLNIAHSVANIGNMCVAPPGLIPGYRYSKPDAEAAYTKTSAFVGAYFKEMDAPSI